MPFNGAASELLAPVAAAFERRLKLHGVGPSAVFWNNFEGQQLRFELLIGVMEDDVRRRKISINDLGCGYGALFEFLQYMPPMEGGRFFGYDISAEMIKAARRRVSDPRAQFYESSIAVHVADYSFASGAYNMKQTAGEEEWNDYVKESLRRLWSKSTKGMAFNMLNDQREKIEDWLYYADSQDFLDFCRTALSPNAILVDSHPLKEWTILIRR